MTENIKKKMLITIAIILAILICWANLHTLLNARSWMYAEGAFLIIMGIVILLHGILMFVLIRTAIRFPPGNMLFRWGFLIFLYSLPMFISYFDNIKFEKRWAARQAAEQRINEGTATTDDFIHLYEDDDKEIIIKAFKHGYRKIAGEILTAVCDTSSNRIFGNYVLRLEYLAKYGREIAQKKVLGLWLIEAAEEGLSEGVEVLLAAGADVNLMNSSGNTPLIAAVRICCPNMVRLFLEQGADVNAMNEYERDALFYAVSCHHLVLDKDEDGRGDRLVNIAKLLIEYGADVGRKYQKPDDETYEPLLSFAKQDSEMAELLTRKYR